MTAHQDDSINVTHNLRLIQLLPHQAARLFELTESNRNYLAKFLPWVPYVTKVEDSKKHIEETIENRAKGITYTYGIEFNGEVIGDISLRNINQPDKTEIGSWMDERFSGRGITTMAVKALTEFGLHTLKFKRILIRAVPQNIASNKVAEKACYTLIGASEDDEYKLLNIWSVEGK